MRIFLDKPFLTNVIICTFVELIVICLALTLNLTPCPLCILQQLCLIGILALSIVGLFKFKKYWFITLTIVLILSILGIYFSGAQVYLQYFSPSKNIAACDTVTNSFIIDAVTSVSGSTSSCSATLEEIPGLSLASYSLIVFILISCLNIVSFLRKIFNNSKES
ncbi:disulfide bond formation protein B [Pseudofrancisella aestuarii]|uniref:Disulfide bond formation protein B n=1 Tax=Pseudofrancisella aestuarii TaxID=2670347 RepID=A0ABV9TEB3_9GAMM|nr:disulfide bond formation protein B [Pseudofrancisella aestuarii]